MCGQAPSDHPEFADFLVDCGIDLISVSPDSFIVVKQHVAAKEAAASGIRGGARQGGGGTRRSSRGKLRTRFINFFDPVGTGRGRCSDPTVSEPSGLVILCRLARSLAARLNALALIIVMLQGH